MNKVQSTLHTKHNLEKKNPFPPTHKKKMEALPLDDVPFHWLHGNFIHKNWLPLFLTWTNSPS
jgi:hypothetical protein